MYKSVYQGGAHVEVFSAQGKDPVGKWKLHGKANAIRKEYDQDLRGFVYVMEGGSTVTRMQLPKSDRQHLALLQPFFVLQLCIPEAANVSVELCISDSGGSRRRVFLSSAHKETSSTPLHARVPLSSLPRGEWFNLCIDLTSLVPKLFRGQQFKSVESVTVGGSCRLRRVFTLKTNPNISGDVPASCTIPHFTSQKIVLVPSNLEVSTDEAPVESNGGTPDIDKPSHVAFGTKIPIPDHVLKSRMSSRNSDSSVTSALSARSDNSMMSNKRDQKLSTLSTKRVLPKIQHKKAAVTPMVLPADTKGPCNIANDKVSSRVVTSQSSSVVNYSPSAYADDMDHMTSLDNDSSVDGDTQLAIDVLRSQSDTSILYHYSSHPHSAQRKSPNANNSLSSDRGPCMDDDFYSSGSSSSIGDVTVVSPSHVQRIKQQSVLPDQPDTIPSPTDSGPVPLLRLSQVYDWRQYQSDVTKTDQQDGSPLNKEMTPHHSIIVGTTDSDEDTSLSATMTGWNNRLLQTPILTSLDDTLERVTSPDTLTRSLEQPLLPTQNLAKRGEELSLEYDSCLNCFYDPKSAKYYQLK